MTGSRRIKLAVLAIVLMAGTAFVPRLNRPSGAAPDRGRLLIRQASMILTMDPNLGHGPLGVVEGGDVLVEGDRIAAVGKRLRRTGADVVVDARGRIVLPGFVDLHTHLWQSLIRGCGTDTELDGWLRACVRPLFDAPMSFADAYAGVRLSTLDEIATGTTTVVDFSHAFTANFARGNLQALRDAGMRFSFAHYTRNDPAVLEEVRRLKRELIDPDPLARLQIGSHPSSDLLEDLTAATRFARDLGVPLNVHLAESPADRAQGQMEALRQAGSLEPGLLVGHAVHLTDGELDELARNDVRVAHNPLSNMRLASGIARLSAMQARNVKVGLGLDGGTNDTSDMFNNMRAAVGLQRASSLDANRYPTPADVLRMATLGGAEALGLQDDVGSLTPGKQADFQIFDPQAINFAPRVDWVSQLVFSGQPSNVEWVFVAGRALKRDSRLVAVDTDQVLKEAQEAADRVRAFLSGSKSGMGSSAGHRSASPRLEPGPDVSLRRAVLAGMPGDLAS